ncbi:DUF1330 domain-containing protein [Hydrogenophaga palleronii]|uniref:DUF1330 domain-containing protein n=1 Tax=Hydrogenophaga palleronii TaxID=65655 RepID=UPI000825A916|nr:DUF1330 domain-containing protein [Hydrogenophaga palleronii]
MPAYIHGNIQITDPVLYEEYRREAPVLVASYGGRYLARGGAATVLEGQGEPNRQVIVEFPDMAQLKAFYHSPEYQRLAAIRQRAATGMLVAIEGV